jgi:hypothetical protein
MERQMAKLWKVRIQFPYEVRAVAKEVTKSRRESIEEPGKARRDHNGTF